MAETINTLASRATPDSPRRRSFEPVRKRLKPLLEVVNSGSKVLRINPVVFSLWLLLPLFLTLTSDWIGLLVVFQAMTAAVRLRKASPARTLAACSPASVSTSRVKGECRGL